MNRSIDLNCDMGERPAALRDGTEELLMKLITSANIACGYHAGDLSTMEATVRLAAKYDVGIGAHPGYGDRANFGRVSIELSPEEVTRLVFEQLKSLGKIARTQSRAIGHLKPHGALYHDAAGIPAIAEAIAAAAARWNRNIVLVGLAGSLMLEVWKARGFRVAAEAFADRLYEQDGTLRSRKFDDAVIRDSATAARQALRIAQEGSVLTRAGTMLDISATTICIHSDTHGAIAIAGAVRHELAEAGIELSGLSSIHPSDPS